MLLLHLLALAFTVVFEAEGVVPEYKDSEEKDMLTSGERIKVLELAKAGTLRLFIT